MKKIIIDRDLLYTKYVVKDKTIEKISQELNVDHRIVKRNLIENNISKETIFLNKITRDELYNLYVVESLSTQKIGEIYGVCGHTISLSLKQLEIPARNKSWRSEGEKNGKVVACVVCGKEFYRKKSIIDKRIALTCSKKCMGIYQRVSVEEKNWRRLYGYKQWRKAVLVRDNNLCKLCGSKKSLCAHHILDAQSYREYRYDISNGITLCKKCHMYIHKNNHHNFIESLKKAIS